jgi:hypothetical protein
MLSHRLAFAAMLFVVSACATATSPEQLEAREANRAAEVFADDPRRGEEIDKLCFASQIDSFGLTTKRAVVVREGGDRYLIETFPGCFDLDWAQALAVDSFGSCLTKGDRILAFDSVFADTRHRSARQSCRVKAIYNWDKDATAETDETEEVDEENASTDKR